jgi:hypothetical protein
MRIKIGNNSNQTKTFKYLFGIELSIYNMSSIEKAFERLEPYYLNEPWDKLNVYLDDKATSDYNLEEQKDAEQPEYIYHIKVDTRVEGFAEILDMIKTSTNFIDCYQCGDIDCHSAIIRFKVSIIKRVKSFLNSKYSEMYKPEELTNIKKNQYIKTRYTYQDKVSNERVFTEPILVLAKDELALNAICERLGLTDDKTISIMKQNEFDSKLNLDNEIIDSRLLCQTSEV